MVGNFGGDTFFDYTAHGDAINTAARLEAANKALGTRICVSGDTVLQIPVFRGRHLGHLLLKGKSKPVEAFEPAVQGAAPDQWVTYERAYGALARGDADVLDEFRALASANPDDGVVALHLARLQDGATGTVIDLRSS